MQEFVQFFLSCLTVLIVSAAAIFILLRVRIGRDADRANPRQGSKPHEPAPSPLRNGRAMIEEMLSRPFSQKLSQMRQGELGQRVGAIAALGESRDQRAIEALIEALGDPEQEVVLTALQALGEREEPAAVNAFVDKLLADPTITYRPSLLRRRLEYRQDDLVAWLIRQVNRGDRDAVAEIGRYGTLDGVLFMQEFLERRDVPLWDPRREEAAKALARLIVHGGGALDQEPELLDLDRIVWTDRQAYEEVLVQDKIVRKRAPRGMTMRNFIVAERSRTATKRPFSGNFSGQNVSA